MPATQPEAANHRPEAARATAIETDTVVIGASAAGLATAACLKRAGLPFEIVERAPHVGPAWRGHYDRLRLHSSRAMSGLPHFGLPRALPRYVPRDAMVGYLEAYAARLGLVPRFSQPVTEIRRDPADGAWLTRTATSTFRSRNVVLATGNTETPYRPHWPGLDAFGGPVLHSAQYRNGQMFAGQDVLVVGIGNSGAEIALDLHEHGARPAIAVRSPVNVVPRDFLGLPIDVWALLLSAFPSFVGDAIGTMVRWVKYGPLARYGLRKLPYGPVTGFRKHGATPILDVGTLAAIRAGHIGVVPAPQSFAPGQVTFTDGSTRRYGAVVLATGYRPSAPALLGPLAKEVLDAEARPCTSGAAVLPGLYFCGFAVNLTGMLHRIACEARAIARAIAAGPRSGA